MERQEPLWICVKYEYYNITTTSRQKLCMRTLPKIKLVLCCNVLIIIASKQESISILPSHAIELFVLLPICTVSNFERHKICFRHCGM